MPGIIVYTVLCIMLLESVPCLSLFCCVCTLAWFPDVASAGSETTCAATDVQCKNGSCVAPALHCDGKKDCDDGADELNCRMCPQFVLSYHRATLVITGHWEHEGGRGNWMTLSLVQKSTSGSACFYFVASNAAGPYLVSTLNYWGTVPRMVLLCFCCSLE